jgi:alkyl hydroperoxide reductase subunit AhpF
VVFLTAVSDGQRYPEVDGSQLDAEIVQRHLSSLPWDPPWPWYPTQLVHVGISADEGMPRIWFAGPAQGMERSVLQELIAAVDQQRQLLSPLARDTARQIARPVDVAVLTTPDCGRCAATVRMVHAMSLTTPLLRSTAIMLDAVPELTGQLSIYQVPVLYINQRRHEGAMNEWIIAQMIQDGAAEPAN